MCGSVHASRRPLTESARPSERLRLFSAHGHQRATMGDAAGGVHSRERPLLRRIGHFADILPCSVNQNGKEARSSFRLAPQTREVRGASPENWVARWYQMVRI